jgi:hypothetical protein
MDPRVELFEIVFRLAGATEFAADVVSSPYIEEVDAWFGPFREHAAVRIAHELCLEHSIGYNAVASLASAAEQTRRDPENASDRAGQRRWPACSAGQCGEPVERGSASRPSAAPMWTDSRCTQT